MKANSAIATAALIFSMATQASTLDEIKSLWNPQGIRATTGAQQTDTVAARPAPARPPVWYRLSNGQQVNLADWKVVLFMQGHCPYCHKFDPVLKSLAQQVGFGVMAYTIDGQGDAAFPEALPAPPEVMKTFFPNLPVATPTTFLVNVNTLEALPLLQGATDEQGFMARMDTVLQMRGADNNG
ncbi:conjugal transfer protein TrbB [Enterobacter hormaechei subsp. hoffmannii]|uniref:type-F conjugative transfer system pilin assembly thiol-disulfide isomerase TrbB n=1 Tax=Enterobacter hormaechei TaxID=158836 RepID=UPI0006278407|nr:type-F conjugative transfer system pilin assembly thiol-disulfide isomerase TrbB [Enterobacter hormaechei]KKJ19540.1 conjugal transfer protein TrbB [Enterobacter hormaechei subsp. hoffmannii]